MSVCEDSLLRMACATATGTTDSLTVSFPAAFPLNRASLSYGFAFAYTLSRPTEALPGPPSAALAPGVYVPFKSAWLLRLRDD